MRIITVIKNGIAVEETVYSPEEQASIVKKSMVPTAVQMTVTQSNVPDVSPNPTEGLLRKLCLDASAPIDARLNAWLMLDTVCGVKLEVPKEGNNGP